MSERPVPQDLERLIQGALPPDVTATRSGWHPEVGSWWFELEWGRRPFELDIPEAAWIEGRTGWIDLRARLAAPRPEATLGGRAFHLSLEIPASLPDVERCVFAIQHAPDEPARRVEVAVTASCGAEERIVAAYLAVKDRLDQGTEKAAATLTAVPGPRPAAAARKIQHYVERRLFEAYRSASRLRALTFDRLDLAYLGVDQAAFARAVTERDQKDWYVEGNRISPSVDLWYTWQLRRSLRQPV